MGDRVKDLKIQGAFIIHFCRHGFRPATVVAGAPPEDAEVVAARLDDTGVIVLTVRSESYPEWDAAAGPIPEADVPRFRHAPGHGDGGTEQAEPGNFSSV